MPLLRLLLFPANERRFLKPLFLECYEWAIRISFTFIFIFNTEQDLIFDLQTTVRWVGQPNCLECSWERGGEPWAIFKVLREATWHNFYRNSIKTKTEYWLKEPSVWLNPWGPGEKDRMLQDSRKRRGVWDVPLTRYTHTYCGRVGLEFNKGPVSKSP